MCASTNQVTPTLELHLRMNAYSSEGDQQADVSRLPKKIATSCELPRALEIDLGTNPALNLCDPKREES